MMAGSKLSMWVLTVCWMGMNLAQAEERSPAQAQGTGGTTAAPVVVPRGYGYQYEHVYWWNPTTRQYEFRWVIVPYGYGAATAAGEETAPAQAAAAPRGYSTTPFPIEPNPFNPLTPFPWIDGSSPKIPAPFGPRGYSYDPATRSGGGAKVDAQDLGKIYDHMRQDRPLGTPRNYADVPQSPYNPNPRGYAHATDSRGGGGGFPPPERPNHPWRVGNSPSGPTPAQILGQIQDRTPIRRFAGSETEANGSGDSTKSLSESAISRAVVAGELAVWGRQNKQATALALAASMLQSTRFVASEQKKHDEQVVREVKADPKKATEVSADSLLAEARTMAGSDKPTLAAVEAIAASMPKAPAPARGYAVGGPYRISSQVRSRSIDTWDVELRGGQTAEVGLIGDGDTDLDLVVYDEYGNRVASDTDGTDRCYVRWTPRWTGKFYVRVVNHGDVYNVYRLMIP